MRFLIISKKMLAIIATISALVILVAILFAMSRGSKDVFNEDIYYKGTNEDKTIAFACNVDWGNDFIPEMLKIFEDKDIKITFFITGQWAQKNPDLVKSIESYNHEIGNHGYKHIDYSKLSYESSKEEISKANEILKDITGITPKLFAPPSGAFNENTIKAAKDLNSKVILWSIDTIDWRNDTTKELIVKRVTSKAGESDIVLMHPTANTIKALPEIINYLFQNGYKIGTISDVID